MLPDGRTYKTANIRSYRNFWAIWDRPPEAKHRHYLLERRDSLLPIDEQKFKGAYYTPLHIVDKAYAYLAATLGENWQERYIVWDMCCGVGNLEVKHSNYRNVFMSTLDQADIDIMRANRTCVGATIFQYDYLNDDVTDFGEIDYGLSGKVPVALRQAIADARAGVKGAKPILVLINPPYGEAGNSLGNAGKIGIATTRVSHGMDHLGYAARELFVQFLHRVKLEVPKSTLAVFSKLKYVNAPNFEKFRDTWHAACRDGFVVHSKSFDSLKGDYPIGFLIWDLEVESPIESVNVIALDKSGDAVGEKKFVQTRNSRLLSEWLPRSKKSDVDAVPLINALTPIPKIDNIRNSKWSVGAVGHFFCDSNDLQNAGTRTAIFSSVSSIGHAGGYFITEQIMSQVTVVFSARRLVAQTWLNDRDQFMQPSQPLSDEFTSDCLIWMLFNGSNLSAGANGLRWNGRDWSLVNHFIPFIEAEVGAAGRFESDFMVRHMTGMAFSPEARAVLDQGRAIWRRFHATRFPEKIRDELKLGRPDAGWYQIRKALGAYGETALFDFGPFKAAYAALGAKLRPMVYDLGFLPR